MESELLRYNMSYFEFNANNIDVEKAKKAIVNWIRKNFNPGFVPVNASKIKFWEGYRELDIKFSQAITEFLKVEFRIKVKAKKNNVKLLIYYYSLVFHCDEKKFNCLQIKKYLTKHPTLIPLLIKFYKAYHELYLTMSRELGLVWGERKMEPYNFGEFLVKYPINQ